MNVFCQVLTVSISAFVLLQGALLRAQDDVRANSSEPADTQVAQELLAPIRHKTMGISPDEHEAYYAILQQAATLDDRQLKSAAARHLAERRRELEANDPRQASRSSLFADMFSNPTAYAGQPVTLSGHVRKVLTYPADDNDFGIETLHELWLFTPDSQSNPVVVVCTSLPDGFPTDGEIIDNVAVTGYFFKVYGYKAQDAARGAPLILAHEPSWNHLPQAQSLSPIAMSIGVIAAISGIVWMAWRTHRKDRAISRRRLMQGSPNMPEQPPDNASQDPP